LTDSLKPYSNHAQIKNFFMTSYFDNYNNNCFFNFVNFGAATQDFIFRKKTTDSIFF